MMIFKFREQCSSLNIFTSPPPLIRIDGQVTMSFVLLLERGHIITDKMDGVLVIGAVPEDEEMHK